jgi:hypothetical protein
MAGDQPLDSPVRSATIRSMRCDPRLLVLCLAAVLVAGCGDTERKVFDASSPASSDPNQQTIAGEIAQLARGKDPRNDIEGAAAHDDAVTKLTARGSAVETSIIDALRSNHDWNVRLGCIEVLQSIGSKICVDHLIVATADEQPLVAFHANKTLEMLTKHAEIPQPGAETGANKLPPVPLRDAKDMAMDAELRVWTEWYEVHRQELRDAWEDWWKQNGAHTRLD